MKGSLLFILLLAASVACDLRSGTATKEMEKYASSPPPAISPAPVESPIDPADIVTVDPALDGKLVNVNGRAETKAAKCDEFNRLMINGDGNTVSITGPCRQIMVNGDGNQITADGAVYFVFNGVNNVLKYSRIVNGKRPNITQNRADNVVEKIAAGAASPTPPKKAK